jgi:osmotically-inducible protein OsmY
MAVCIISATEDGTLGDRVRDRLDQCGHAAMRMVACSVEQGCIRLTGRTRTYYLKQLAQEIARATPGVTEIANDIHVRTAERASRD